MDAAEAGVGGGFSTSREDLSTADERTGDVAATLEAGRELDALVAERVMGWQDVHPENNWDARPSKNTDVLVGVESVELGHKFFGVVPDFSTDIAAAWQVVEHMHKLLLRAELFTLNGHWVVAFGKASWVSVGGKFVEVEAETAPLAICRAALAAVQS